VKTHDAYPLSKAAPGLLRIILVDEVDMNPDISYEPRLLC